ncbi:hypothetical protein PRIPAC_90057 [Pristionchus pacificus]|uniref:RING-type domain-containing protein n=1 Tax=Pristionchus pacificus TaxID=54126 RepID=A0A2A6B6T5_PRIPA|nr:hypothetical protein PRIPAC_90057 [Pristionchus pacificus]|eukprot:PDM61600.1 hypothetical protein PRIPAC_51042 [Pristionchus pacificus]
MANRPTDWQSFPVEFSESFPSLQASASTAKQKRGSQVSGRVGKRGSLGLPFVQPVRNFWNNRRPANPSANSFSGFTDDDVRAAEQSVHDPSSSFSNEDTVEEPELIQVFPVFRDKIMSCSRFDANGYEALGELLTKKLMNLPHDPSEKYRSNALTANEYGDTTITRSPDPSATPKWTANLPDRILTDEYRLISYLRHLAVPLGPKAIEAIKKTCNYNSKEKRMLPLYKTDPIVAPPPKAQVKPRSRDSQSSTSSWKGPSNDVRLSGTSPASSSNHDVHASHNYGRQNKSNTMLKFLNSNFPNSNSRVHVKDSFFYTSGYKGNNRRDYTNNRQPKWTEMDDCASSSAYNPSWDDCYERPASQSSSRYDDYGGGGGMSNGYYRSGSRNSKNDFDNSKDSGFHGEYNHDEYHDRNERPVSPIAEPIDFVVTEFSRKTPKWKPEYVEPSERRRNATGWRGRWSNEVPIELKEEKSIDEKREEHPDARFFWKCPDVSTVVRRAFRCLDGISANSSAAFADDMHRVELSTWVGDEDAEEVAYRTKDKFGLGRVEREAIERTVQLALPRTTITLCVGAGGEAEIVFDGDCTDVLVKRRIYDEIKAAITESVLKTRDFSSYAVDKIDPDHPVSTRNTVITFGSVAEAREARERLRDNEIDAKVMPRDLIMGNWDGNYAKRECILELEWERHGTHGIMVRFNDLMQQNNLVDKLMRTKSDYFSTTLIRIEEHFNKMYVAIPFSPYPVSDDLRFLKNILEENGVSVASIYPQKCKDGPQTIDNRTKQSHCTLAINRRMLKVAIEEGVWAGFHPSTDAEWQMMLEGGRFSWMVEIHDEFDLQQSGMNSATVRFDSYEQGERIASQVQRMTPMPFGEDRFILNKDDKKGVFARAKLRVHYFVSVHVMAVTRNRLRRLDETWRANSYFTHADFRTEREPFVQWTCLITDHIETTPPTPPGFCRLIVEGFPKSAVEDGCAELLSVIRGDVIKCDKDEQWLLTGIGRNMANTVAKEALDKYSVLVDFNVLGKEIRLIGEKYETKEVEKRLRMIAKRRDSLMISTLVTIEQPLYMNRASIAIMACGGLQMVERVVGGCRITTCADDADKRTLRFEGTVAAYDRFRDFLADLDDTLRDSAKSEYEKMRKTNEKMLDPSLSPLTSALLCPICFCRPSADFYRLEACGHVYCTACIYHQLHSELSTRTLPLVCRREGCDCKLAVSDLLRLLLGRDVEGVGEMRVSHLDEMKLRPLVTAIVTNALQTKRDRLIACRTADCTGIFARQNDSNSIVRCKACERTTCGSCGYEPHRGYECEEYESLRDNVDVSIASYMKNKKVRKCPNKSCSALIEKTVGCNHMECVICRTHFCWLCGHASYSQGDIYAHMQNDHGGNGLHMDDGEMFMLQFDD